MTRWTPARPHGGSRRFLAGARRARPAALGVPHGSGGVAGGRGPRSRGPGIRRPAWSCGGPPRRTGGSGTDTGARYLVRGGAGRAGVRQVNQASCGPRRPLAAERPHPRQPRPRNDDAPKQRPGGPPKPAPPHRPDQDPSQPPGSSPDPAPPLRTNHAPKQRPGSSPRVNPAPLDFRLEVRQLALPGSPPTARQASSASVRCGKPSGPAAEAVAAAGPRFRADPADSAPCLSLRMDPGDPAGDPAGEPAAGDTAGDPASGECVPMGRDPLLFLQTLQTLWSTRELGQLREEAQRGFAALEDPLAALLDMLDGSRGWRGKGPSLEAWVARELKRCLQAQPCPGPARGSPGLKQLQARAVKLLAESPPGLVEPLVSIFQLQDADRSPLLAHVHRLHQEGKFNEAIVLGTKLRLQADLDVEKTCIPLLLQDKADLVERYVDGFPDLQRRLLALLDSWCQPGFDIRVVARRYPQTTLRLERLSPRALGRQVLRLLERHGLDPALCPNVVTQQRLAALRYLCYKRLVERSVPRESWAEHVQGLVGQDQGLQEQLLASHDDAAPAAPPALGLLLPEQRLPASVAAELRQLRVPERTAEAPLEDGKDDYYQLPISREHLHFLASWEDLARHQEELLQPGRVVSVDLEWRPSFGAGGRPRASLMQVAVEGRVFLLDLPRLSSPAGGQAPQAFSRLVSRLLADPSITKLGYGMAGDLRSLGASCPALAQAEKQLQGSVDLLQVHRQMRAADRPAPGVDGAAGPRGLSLLVRQVLGKPLDKMQQLSNWDRRPLGEGQLVYAAADAYCLLEVYWALCREPARFHLSGDLARSLRLGRGERAGAGELPPLQKASASPQQVPAGEDAAPEVPARAFRVVCDSMLQGLARRLRCLGIDVLVLATGEDHRRAAEVARREGRIILTSGLPYHKLRAQVGAGRCLSVDCSLKARQQATAVIRHFNVRVTHSDIFSRCQACNCHQYLKVSKDVMKQLVWLSGHPEGPSGTGDEATQIEDERETGSAPEEAPGGCAYDPSCRWLEEEDLQSRVPARLGNGTRLQLSGVPAGVLRRPGLRHFYCCTGCGKVFWEGSHLGRVAENFREVLEGVPGSREPSRAPSPAGSPS
ncbi:exonuclease mut-7 homolog isoform X4 [Balaenoptera musculus]|uniref:Exonuclease mut-7 homolog isoform X4 n=1 Tax=Balaenoptera musculus TaxID=9771 RepID=A0A8B8XLG4_BALMU|nr:exonuclease mut-7 homolog isoform X4 [Balaenoptera musculus]